MRRSFFSLVTLAFWSCSLAVSPAIAQTEEDPSAFSCETCARHEGFFTLLVDADKSKIYAEIPAPGEDGVSLRMIHTEGLTGGLGSNPLGLDRGWWSEGEILAFRKIGDKVILEVENLSYRADPENPLEARAVKESFATSFAASVEIKKTSDTSLTVDLTPFLTSDTLNLAHTLQEAKQGSFSLSADRTMIDAQNSFAFPDNVEIDVFQTFSSKNAGREVSTTAANGKDATLIKHHSFVRLPEEGYTPLPADPRTGAISVTHYDYSTPLGEPIKQQIARRYRLQKNEAGETINPIVFYIDPGAPEPIRSALVDGAEWWADAFAAAGFPDGYRVELLPEDAHPFDIRYNVVQWVHRQTRGWSYGGGIHDPRTGEMLKGHVILGSLRVRQDIMIFEGLAGTENSGTGEADDPIEIALARIRQLSAHEIGHSLGFAHNFAASTYGKGSVMDYPAPDIRVMTGELDFSEAYGVGIGEWDKFAATWLYGEMTPEEREALIQKSITDGLVFVDDSHARNVGTGHPLGNIWDNGDDPYEGLREAINVRAIAMENFGEDRLAEGRPRYELNDVFVPIYLFHRYQVPAAAKLVGGLQFNYSVVGDGQPPSEPVNPGLQRLALMEILKTVRPEFLDIPEETLALLTPSLDTWMAADPQRELFKRTAYPAFDTLSAADTAADLTFSALLHPQRVARLIEFHRRDPDQFSAADMFSTIQMQLMSGPPANAGHQEILETVRARYAYALMDLADADTSSAVKSAASSALSDLKDALEGQENHRSAWLAEKIDAFEDREFAPIPPVVDAKPLPPGGPIGGMGIYETGWFDD
ncbi:MAG: hypothetical protein CMK09_10260 [Ponticaulis sp.]|nr:hypothetical protein [Ponticaulis sp.]|tara:strand:+ start:381 stop:2828 length:2448 start_codon:yes stop_codon:yes gene_type:complete